MGPLTGLKFIEMAGMGPAPFCGMLLADLGAEVITIGRKSVPTDTPAAQVLSERGKRTIALNLKTPEGVEAVLKLCEGADALFEGFRPGVMEKLGLGPEQCLARNPKLVFGRMTGWGQTGPLAQAAGHDINYISLSGALHGVGRRGEKPLPPSNLVGDFGGGAMYLAFGLMCAIHEAGQSGKGQVVDVSMVEGSASLMTMMYTMFAGGGWKDDRGINLLDGGAHFYDSYETSDGKYISLGSIEPQFYQQLVELAELDPEQFSHRSEDNWPALAEVLEGVFKQKTRDEWCELMEGTDVCFAPILSMAEAPHHPHNVERGSFVTINDVEQPAPAPRFSRSEATIAHPPKHAGIDTDEVLRGCGYSDDDLSTLREQGVLT
jgi:alpha-methylacyl-CoA racemase